MAALSDWYKDWLKNLERIVL